MSKKVKQFTKQVYYPEIISDKTEELLKLSRKSQIHEHNEVIKDRRSREEAKTARILTSKEDKNPHALNLIITHAEMANSPQNLENGNDPTTFTIPYYDFNFENSKLFKFYLDELKNAGCFQTWTTNPFKSADRAEFIFSGVNSAALAHFKASMEIVKFPTGETVTYQNNILFFKLGDGTPDSIDFSDAPVWKNIIESFLELRKRTLTNVFTPAEVMNMHNQLFGKAIERRYLAQQISNIRNKKIKNELEGRFKIEFDKSQDSWVFTLY